MNYLLLVISFHVLLIVSLPFLCLCSIGCFFLQFIMLFSWNIWKNLINKIHIWKYLQHQWETSILHQQLYQPIYLKATTIYFKLISSTQVSKQFPTNKKELIKAYSRYWFIVRMLLVELFPEIFPVMISKKVYFTNGLV